MVCWSYYRRTIISLKSNIGSPQISSNFISINLSNLKVFSLYIHNIPLLASVFLTAGACGRGIGTVLIRPSHWSLRLFWPSSRDNPRERTDDTATVTSEHSWVPDRTRLQRVSSPSEAASTGLHCGTAMRKSDRNGYHHRRRTHRRRYQQSCCSTPHALIAGVPGR